MVSIEGDPSCGVGDSDHYFDPGVTVDLVVFESPGYCFGLPTAHAPSFKVLGRLPRSG